MNVVTGIVPIYQGIVQNSQLGVLLFTMNLNFDVLSVIQLVMACS